MPASLPAGTLATRRPVRLRWGIYGLACLLAAGGTLYTLVLIDAAGHQQDLDTYLRAGRDLLAGRPLYLPFLAHPFPDATLRPAYIYPPIFAVLVVPLSILPATLASWLWIAAMQSALGLTLVLGLKALKPTAKAAFLALLVTLTFYPLWVDAIQGQANALLLALVTIGIVLVIGGRPQGGLALGAAAALKLTPLLLLGWLLWERRWRPAAWMAAGFALFTGAGAILRPMDTITFYAQVLPQLSRGTAYYSNQSLSGVLARLLTGNAYTDPWVRLPAEPLIAGLAAFGLIAFWAAAFFRHGGLARPLAFLPLLPLTSPVTWEHHLILVLPLLWIAIVAIAERGWPPVDVVVLGGLLAAFDLLPRWHPGPSFGGFGFRAAQTGDPLVLLAANGLFCATIALLVLSPWLLRAR
jgi:alpha-1,2-mannosyltransferase